MKTLIAPNQLAAPAAPPPDTAAAPQPALIPQQSIAMPSGSTAINPLRLATDERGRVNDPARGAPAASIARVSLLPDVEEQRAEYARLMNLPPDAVGVDRDGHIVYSDPGNGGMMTRVVPGGVAPAVLSSVGPGVSMAGAIAGGAAMPWAGGVPGAALGGALADYGRQALGRSLAGLEGPLSGQLASVDWPNVAGQALLGGGGQAAGGLLNLGARAVGGAFTRNPLGIEAYDRTAATLPANLAEWNRVRGLAQTHRIPLDLGQITNLPSNLTTLRQLGRYPETMDARNAFYRAQQGAGPYPTTVAQGARSVPDAVEAERLRLAGQRQPTDVAIGENPQFPPRDAAGNTLPRPGMIGAAGDIVERAGDARTAIASPHYQAAFASGPGPDVTPILTNLRGLIDSGRFPENTATARSLEAAYRSLTREVALPQGGTTRVPTTNYEGMHNAKLAMDSALQELERGGAARADIRVAERNVADIQETLTNALTRHNPDYARGYQLYIEASPAVEAIRRDLGALARMTASDRRTVLHSVFGPEAIPQQVERMRQAFLINGRIGEWNAGFGTWMDNQLAQALRPLREGGEPGNVAGAMYQAFRGPGAWPVVEAALGGAQNAAGLRGLTDVLQAVSRIMPMGSQTATDLAAGAATAAERVGRAARIAGAATSPSTLLNAGNLVAEMHNAVATPAARVQLLNALRHPDALNELQRLRMMNPASADAIALAFRIVNRATTPVATEYGGRQVGSAISPPTPRMPTMQQGQEQ